MRRFDMNAPRSGSVASALGKQLANTGADENGWTDSALVADAVAADADVGLARRLHADADANGSVSRGVVGEARGHEHRALAGSAAARSGVSAFPGAVGAAGGWAREPDALTSDHGSSGACSASSGTDEPVRPASSTLMTTATPASLSVSTDKADYAPGTTATFTVTGVQVGSSVRFQVADLQSAPGINGIADIYVPFTVTDGGLGDADGLANGTIITGWQVPGDGSATGAGLNLTVTNGNASATTTFTDAATNKITVENQKAGTSQDVWAIHGSISNGGDEEIEGFTTQISVNAGQTIQFKIDTALNGYHVDIYRLGYYGGDGARLITSFSHAGAANQPAALFNSATRTVDAGNWSVTDSWLVPTNAVSGVYFAKLTTNTGDFENLIPFVVRNDGVASDILFQTSDETWQAYNPWGGYNLYAGADGTRDTRAYAVSYNRPIAINSSDNLSQAADYVFGEEFATLYWLEQNGYDVSYISGLDAATNASLLLNTKVYLDTGHDEYWTQSQYNNVQAAAKAGVNLAFLSGNNTYWDSALTADASGTANRVLVQYKDIWSGQQLNPNFTPGGAGSGLFRDPQYGPGVPENALVGTIFTVDEVPTLTDITVPAAMSKLRFWVNTSVATNNGGTLQGLLGYEWHSDLDNGFRPGGLIDLSSTTETVGTLLLDNGLTTGTGTATHSLTLYRDTTSGALIFSAGTVMWSWGLDDQHTSYGTTATPVSPDVQQAMVNLFADMGVAPGTLQSSLIFSQTADHTAPTSTITSPTTNGTVTQGQVVTITGTASDVGGIVAGVNISTDGGASWHPTTGTTNWSYNWTVTGIGTQQIQVRAIDSSVNLQTTLTTLSVTANPSPYTSLFSLTDTPSQTSNNDGQPIELGVKFSSAASGTIAGIRFYRGNSDTGTDIVDLWSTTGTLLATGIYSGSGTGWQTVTFATPYTIAANTTYIASYHSTGGYTSTAGYFTTAHTTGALTAPSDAAGGGNGLYVYGASAFPGNTAGGTNYWVDVLFQSGPNAPPTANSDAFSATQNTALTILAADLLSNDTDPNADTLSVTGVTNGSGGTVAFNGATNDVIFTPTAGYTGPASFTYAISDGHGGVATGNVAVTVNPPGLTTYSLFVPTDTPSQPNNNDGLALEVGVKFRSTTPGDIAGIKFYRSARDTGADIVDLWSSTGTLLATGTYTGSGTGWQTVTLSAPYSIAANTTYVVSYHSTGGYAATGGYFTTAHTSGVLSALSDTAGGGNGVYVYGASAFPTQTYGAANYWVDVVFTTGANVVPVANADSFTTGQNTALAIAAAQLLGNDTDANSDTLVVISATSGSGGTASFSSVTNTVTFTPTNGYIGPASFTYTISDGRGGTATATVNVDVTVPNTPPVANSESFTATQNAPLTITLAQLLQNDSDANGDTLTVTGVTSGSGGTVTLDSQAGTVTFLPSAGYVGAASFSYTIADGKGGTATASDTVTVNGTGGNTFSLFTATDTPASPNNLDGQPLELGVKFTSSSAGTVAGIKFYRSSSDTGTDIVDLWSPTGTLLATGTYTGSGSGWQTVTLSTPYVIAANTVYTASYHTTGGYAATSGYFTSAHTSGTLTALSSSASGGNGVYAYGASAFPTQSFGASNYWVDVVFTTGANAPPVAVADSFTATQNTPLTLTAAQLLANDQDPNADTLTLTGATSGTGGTATFNSTTNSVTFTPTSGFTGVASFTYGISDGHSGTATGNVSVTVNGAGGTTYSLFTATDTPSSPNNLDPQALEIGVKFTSTQAGTVSDVKFYRAASDTGVDYVHLWSSTGTLLATGTYTGTDTGWQTVALDTPYTISADTSYVASYHSDGSYAATSDYFAAAKTSGPLTAPSSAASGGNGVYAYTSGATTSLFPTNSYGNSNYYVDLVLNPLAA